MWHRVLPLLPFCRCSASLFIAVGGVQLGCTQHAECDVAVTKDRDLVLCHDANFKRLALAPDSAAAATPTCDLTLGQLAGLPLKSGSSPPRLVDVLRTCRAIGDPARLVLEIKPGNDTAVEVLGELHAVDTALFDTVSVVMSFDLAIARASANLISLLFPDPDCTNRPVVMFLRATHDYCGPFLTLSQLDVSVVDDYLGAAAGSTNPTIDGLYIQFEPGMLIAGDPVADNLRALCKRCVVGIWGAPEPQDRIDVACQLVAMGASFVNTDLPPNVMLPPCADSEDGTAP